MSKYCMMCGVPIENSGPSWCDSCLAARETAAASAAASPSGAAPRGIEFDPRSYADWVRNVLLRPSKAVVAIAESPGAIPGAILAALGSAAIALVSVLYLHRTLSGLGLWASGLMGAMTDDLYGGGFSVPYVSIFFRLLLLLLLQWGLLSLALTGAARLFKTNVAVVRSLNIVGASKLLFAAGWLTAYIVSFVIPALAVAIALASLVAGYLLIERGVRPSVRIADQSFYLVPSAIGLYVLCTMIVWKILF